MTDPTPTEIQAMVARLRAPSYWFQQIHIQGVWFSGSVEGHEGENSAPVEAAEMLDALAASRAQVERLREALKITAAIIQADRMRTNNHVFEGTWKISGAGFTGTVDDALDKARAALSDTQPPEAT